MSDVTAPMWLGDPAHARWLEEHFDDLLRFGAASVIDTGFGNLDADGKIPPAQPEGHSDLYVTCRMLYTFSLGLLMGRPGYAALVDHGLTSLRERFADPVNGGWFASINADGPVDRSKQAYAHAFVLLATATATIAGRPGAAELLRSAIQVNLDHFWREDEGMVLEGYDEAWTQAEPYRGVNANMHTVEAYLAVADATGDDAWRVRAVRIIERVIGYAANQSWRIPEHFTAQWEPLLDYNVDDKAHPFRPFGATGGHSFEWARLALQVHDAEIAAGVAAEQIAWMREGAQALFDAAVTDSWAVDGAEGFVYTVDFDGVPAVRARMHWVVAEALGAAVALWRVTGDERYADLYVQWWEHAATHFIDGSGSWIHELDHNNQPSGTVWAGKSDIYHVAQATLIPRLPLAPTFARALRQRLLDA